VREIDSPLYTHVGGWPRLDGAERRIAGPEERCPIGGNWAAVAAALPMAARAERERPFWQALAAFWAGEGRRRRVRRGFHVRLLGEIGVEAVGFDAVLAAVKDRAGARLMVADVASPPLRDKALTPRCAW